jgi:hypothetical protein
MGKGRKSGAQITSGWDKVVDATAMEASDVFMFRFSRSRRDGLKLTVQKLV